MFSIFIKETKEFLRDKTSLFFYIMFPVIMIFLLGNLLSSIDKAEDTIGDIRIQYLVETGDPFQTAAIKGFIDSAGKSNSLLKFEEIDNLDTAKKLAGEDEITAAVVFTGNPMEIRIYEGTNQIKNRAVKAIFNGFVQNDKAISTVMMTNPQTLEDIEIKQEEFVKQKDFGIDRNMMDYYAVTMLAMICFMSMLVGASAFMGERKNKTINRLIIVPQNRILIFLQKIFGMLPPVFLQILVIMGISVFVFKANYAATFKENAVLFVMFLVVTLCVISIGAIIGMIVKRNPMIFVFPIVWIMMFLGGTNSKEIYVKGISDVMPIYQVQEAAFDLAIFGNYERTFHVIAFSIIIMIAALAIGAFLFSRKEEER